MKTSSTAIIAAIFFALVSFECFNLYRKEHQTSERLLTDLQISRDSCTYFVARDGARAVKIQVQQLTISELRKTLPGVLQAAKGLYIPPRLIQGYTQAIQQSRTEIKTVVRDSIIHDTIQVKTFNYRDRFNTVRGIIQKDIAVLSIQSQDTITIFNTTGRRRHPLAWILSKRLPDQIIIKNANPDNKIILKESIKIKQ